MRPEFFHQSYKQKPSKMRLNYTANSFGIGHINRKYAPRTYSVNIASENVRNASELHGKQLRFWTRKS